MAQHTVNGGISVHYVKYVRAAIIGKTATPAISCFLYAK